MFCLYCGNSLPEDALFCNRCGKRQGEEQAVAPSGDRIQPGLAFPGTFIGGGQASSGNVPLVQGTPQASTVPTLEGTAAPLDPPAGGQPLSHQMAPPSADEAAPTVLATDATTALPKEGATPVRQASASAHTIGSSSPPAGRPETIRAVKPGKRSTSLRLVLVGLAGLVIVALASGIAWFTAHRASPAGSISEFAVLTANSSSDWIAAGPDGNLWFTYINGHKIGRISPSGTITEFPLPNANSFPVGITAGPDGNLWFTEAIYTGTGNNLKIIGGKIGRITSGK